MESSPTDEVLRLPELLEMILQHLPQKDLLLSQRVSRSFRHTILGSTRLQKALFFAPDWLLEGRTFDAYAADNRPGRKPENNRLLRRAFEGCYPTIKLAIVNDKPPTAGELAIGRRGSEHWSWDVCISFPAASSPSPPPSHYNSASSISPAASPAVLYPEASWRRMYLSQPPCTSLHLVRRWQRSPNEAVVREDGITMGAFVAEATKVQKLWHESYISSDRDWHFEGNIRCSSLQEEEVG